MQVCLRTDDMDLAGDILQELCVFLNITELASTADFPEEFDRLGETLRLVNNFYGSQKSVINSNSLGLR